ncbi:MAG: phenylalanine--tRNA ligase subunit beta [Myxococcota bacterium]|nr:phenylalanine--tRNA ligase subunit beta [Myxococcota bacterium]
MRVPVSLLKSFVDIPVSVEELANLMNGRMAEVEHILRFPSRETLKDVCVATLLEVEDENEDWALWRCSLPTGTKRIVVGKKYNVAAGESYAAIPEGGLTPTGDSVVVQAVGGFQSEGMLVSESMLGIGEEATQPLCFGPDINPSEHPYDLLELDDAVLEFDLEPNRPDLFSLLGMARDLSAIFDGGLCRPARVPTHWEALPESELRVDIQAKDRVQRYAGLEVSGICVGPSPQWLQNAVRKLGMRPINNVVDSANLAMLEFGQPMHTFDRASLKTSSIGLRMAREDERITTLDGETRTLTEECLLVTDGDTPIALAGVMGDAHSEIVPSTTELFIESATFDMATVRRASRRLSLRTESSLRFEKGLPTSQVIPAMARLAHLLSVVAGPNVTIGRSLDVFPAPPKPKVLDFSPEEARARMGMPVPNEVIRARFERLGIQVDEAWRVVLPDFRPDLNIQADLNEEVGRIQGYESVVAEPPAAPLHPPRENPIYTKGFQLRAALNGAGFDEVYLGIWVGEQEITDYRLNRDVLLDLKNPLTSDLTHFRPTALPDLLKAVALNRKTQDSVRLFEIAKVYQRTDGSIDERHHLSGAWTASGADTDGSRFYQTRDCLLDALGSIGAETTLSRPAEVEERWHLHTFHPGRWVALSIGGQTVGVLGELHPAWVKLADLPEAPVTFHIDLQALLELQPAVPRFSAPARYPSVEYHLNVLAPRKTYVRDVLAHIEDASLDCLVRHTLHAVYAGQGVPEDKKRLTLELEFNHAQRSLTHEETLSQVQSLRPRLERAGLVVEF